LETEKIALCGELAFEEAMAFSQGRLLSEDDVDDHDDHHHHDD
jgi:hypothetical protein